MKNGIELPIIPLGKPGDNPPKQEDVSISSVAQRALDKYEAAFLELAK